MTSFHIVTCLVMVASAGTLAAAMSHPSSILELDQFQEQLEARLEFFTKPRHPKEENNLAWRQSRDFVRKAMKNIGLDVKEQCFNTSVAMDNENNEEVTGCNIIGITRGTSTKHLVVVGAHYDSSGLDTDFAPLKDNGVGIVTMLEVAKAFEQSVRWKGFAKNYTTIFVAFDLNTKEQFPVSPGHSGSYVFVNEWLSPKLLKERRVLHAAYIIDSITNYNTNENTQVLAADFKVIFPDANKRIHDDGGMQGDFLAVVGTEQTQSLVDDFAGHYRMDRAAHPYRLQEMVTKGEDLGQGNTLKMFDHQASFHFWTSNPSLNAVLLTDTGNDRTNPRQDCELESVDCGFVLVDMKERTKFVYHTYDALTRTLLDSQTTYVGLHEETEEENGSMATSPSSLVAVLLTMLLARVIL